MLSRSFQPLLRPRSHLRSTTRSFSQHHALSVSSPRAYRKGESAPSSIGTPNAKNAFNKYQPLGAVPQQTNAPIHASAAGLAKKSTDHGTNKWREREDASTRAEPQSTQSESTSSEPLPDLRDGIPSEFDPKTTPLPDLMQGIPSTIDAELAQASKGKASLESLNITEEGQEQPVSSDGRGNIPGSSYVSSSDRRRSALTKYFYAIFGVGSILYAVYIGRDWSDEEAILHPDIPQGYSPSLIYQRAIARWGSTVSYYTDPVTKKLLPDAAVMDPNMPPYTLVIGLEDVLVHSEWSRAHGWRIAKRPGLDYFIKYLSPYYELVLFSAQPSFVVDQVHRKIDPYQMVYPLFREMTVYEDGDYVKDLSYLNRDLKKVVTVDCNPHAVKKQPENAIIIPPWTGDPNDTTLIDLIPFLENLASLGYQDTREVLKSFEGKNIAQEFDRRQKVLREKHEASLAGRKRRGGSSGLGSIFGAKPRQQEGLQSIHEAEAQGKMYSDIIRDRGQDMYQRLVKHLETEGPKILAEREAMEKKMQDEAMASMKTGMFSYFGGGSKKE